MRRFYAPPDRISAGSIVLGPEETRHLRDVLRLRAGDECSVFDGEGREYLCTIESVKKNEAVLRVEREISPASPESPLEITVAAAILPGDRFEITVQKAVELGVVRLQPLYTRRCEVKPGGGKRNFERWQKIALESAKQCGRARTMRIDQPVEFDEFIAGKTKRIRHVTDPL
ncbi:MAG: 16S rRNA (uracil(1498)-N(3))-methyltransferase [Chloracidobacterium sp.]|nr:16S rRNA (uracil(1498)-N(3))-methyltransferase [Chloracidobacterium sp.]